MTVPLTVTKAIAPLAAAVLHGLTGSYTSTALTTGAACTLAAALLLFSRPGGRSTSPPVG
jgi:hypothetical protein